MKVTNNQATPILESALSTSNKAPTRNLLREIESITDQQALAYQRDGMKIQDITFLEPEYEKIQESFSVPQQNATVQIPTETNSMHVTLGPHESTGAIERGTHEMVGETFMPMASTTTFDNLISNPMNDIWQKLSKEVNRTFLYVDSKLSENKNWLNSMKCDLNDLQKSIIQAFNIDVRKSEYDNREVTIQHGGKSYSCQNGVFMKEIMRLAPNKEKNVNPCFGEFSLIMNRPKQVSIRCVSPFVNFMTLDRYAFAESIKDMQKKKVDKDVGFLETIPCLQDQPRHNLEYFSKQMKKVYFKRN